ncbi:hypothetical protein B0H66DRAFT_565631 [Apodospora peruviana]|uniref:Uncharacterized protein n=1 Tax=Apodospora peruviana TaxID=516989 RepID=A0AAE0HZC9_9PEZI|nr:hypothetical protein B0H66DRAFT_565631 [Apodospora peruviana]
MIREIYLVYSWYIKYRGIQNATLVVPLEKHGAVVRLAPNELRVNCYVGGLKTIYAGGCPRSDWYSGLGIYQQPLHDAR